MKTKNDYPYEYYSYMAFRNSNKGKFLTTIEFLGLSFVLGCIIYLLMWRYSGSGTLNISFFFLSQAISLPILGILFGITEGPLFVFDWFPPTHDDVLHFKFKRREEIRDELVELESSYFKKKRMLEGELAELYK